MWTRALVDADASCGGKAVGLARLIAAGARVPEGFVIDARAFAALAGAPIVDDRDGIGHALADAAARIAAAEIPAELIAEVAARIDALGASTLLAVRSSATIEDGDAGAAAGVFSSRRAVAPADVWDAIRAVWTSALTPLAASYARQRGATARIAIGVIVQRFVPGARVTVYTRPAGAPTADEVWIQRGAHVDRRARGADDPIVVAAIAAEHAIGAAAGADVELVEPAADGDAGAAPWIVQARPLVHPIAHARRPAPPTVTAALVADGRRWSWDLAHNPDPLSPAQIGLVERVERAACAPWSLRVCGGYLYTAARADAPASPAPPHDRAELVARATAIEAELARTLGCAPSLDAPAPIVDVPSLADAIARYLDFYAIWAGTLSPLIAAARAPLRAALVDESRAARWLGARPSAVEATLAAAARGELDDATVLARLGALSPCWDVATPTFAERPGILRDAIARAAAIPRAEPPPAPPAELARAVELARAAADLAERDDLWFARAQQLVRRALLAHAAALGVDADDAAWLPLDELAAATAIDRDDAHRRASATRAAVARAASWDMPAIVGGELPISRAALHGVGTGGRVTGRVVRFASLASAIAVGAGDVIVTRAVTPALAVLVTGCAALVSESGGLLDHGAALARELGIPCVVGCVGAWATLADGALVTVDGASGRVIAIDAPAQSSSSS